jgi:hypothetical protein
VTGVKILKSSLVTLSMLAMTACGVPENSIEVKTAREAAAANCDQTGKCVKDPSGLVLYNSDLVTENLVLKRQGENQTLLTKLFNLIDEPKLLVTAEKLEPLMRGVAIVGEFEPCDSPKGIDGANPTAGQLRSLRQGRYKACITYVGEGFFKKAFALAPIDVDTTPPEVSKIGVAHSAVTDTSAALTWTRAGDNLTLEGKLIYSVYTSRTNVLDSLEAVRTYGRLAPDLLVGGTNYTISSLSESTDYQAAVIVTDEAGNQSLVGNTNFQTAASDATPPSLSSILINAAVTHTNSTAATLTLSAGEASEMYVTNTDGCSSGGAWEAYGTSKAWTLAQTNATATVYAKFRDLAGNESACVSDTIIHDDIAPTAPNVIGATPTNDTTPSWSWTSGGGGNGAYRYKLNNADLTTGASETTDATFTASPALSEGTHTLYVQERDAAGNWSESGSHAIDIDTTLPTLTISDASDNFINTSNQTSYSGITGTCSTADGSVTVTYVKTPSAPVVWSAACTSGNWTAGAIDISSFSDGIVTITATQTDSAGNVGTASTSTIKDSIAPTAPSVIGATPTNDTTPSWSWTSGGGGGNGTYRYKLGDSNLSSGATETSSLEFTPPSALAEGTHTLYVQERDDAGNWSESGFRAVVIDITPPSAPNVTGTTPTGNATPTWSWSSGGNGGSGTYRYKLNDTNVSTGATETASTSFTAGAALSEATHTLYVQERDAAGNWSTSGSFAIQVVTPPAAPTLSNPTRYVTSLGLSWASVPEATSYNLYWSTLPDVTTASTKISDVVSVYTHTPLTGGTTHYYKLAAVKNGVESALSNEVSAAPYSYAAPTVIAISPNSGSTDGGTSVTIIGTGFVSSATVSIGGANATGVTFGSATSLTATTPAGALGAKNVVVTNPDGQTGTLTGGYTYSIPVCPTNYVKVAANATLGTSEFCVAKYEIKNSGGNIAVSEAQGLPWVDIPRDTSNGVTGAIARCQELSTASAKYDLISNAQWQALAREIETAQSSPGVYLNWSNNSTSGTNYMNRGHSDNSPGNALAASTDNDPCSGTGNTNCATSSHADFNQKRTHTLKSGEIIWDVAGNVYEWVKDNNNASQGSDSYVSTNSWISEVRLKFGPEGNYSTNNSGEYGGLGYGRLNSSAGTVVRGGDWNNDAWTGVFAAGLHVGPTLIWYEVGFRCVLLLEPGAPTSVAGAAGDTQVTLTWSAPANNGGSAITDYVIQSSSDNGSNWVTFNDGTSTATSATVTGLVNWTSYIFRVAAVNSSGTGTTSSNSASITPQSAYRASGGTVSECITTGGVNYVVHTFTSVGSSTFTVFSSGSSLSVDYLIVGGGGAGGSNYAGGGGGAGGFLTGTGVSLASGSSNTITVGQGGTSVSGVNAGNNGGNTTALGLTAFGGGGGGSGNEGTNPGGSGIGGNVGSGGGGGGGKTSGGTGGSTTNTTQGKNGGNGRANDTATSRAGAGGGGAAAAGTNPMGQFATRGGDGLGSSYGNCTTTLYYGAGGGGGSVDAVVTSGSSGGYPPSNVGGRGGTSYTVNGGNATANRGGGGGGAGLNGQGGNGSDGIVIIRYVK